MKKAKPHVIVTGGAQGIGRVVMQLCGGGYSVSVFDIDSEAMEELKPSFRKHSVSFHITDVSNEVSVRSSSELP